MFQISRPSEKQIAAFLRAQAASDLSYKEVGATREGNAPPGYVLDHNRVCLGDGAECFARAQEAIRSWQMFQTGWTKIFPERAPIEKGTNVCVVARSFKLYSLHGCRIVYVIDEKIGQVERFGFAYGTLRQHAERGEERFTVEHNMYDDSVWYDLLAFSRPQNPLARLGYPLTRRLQKQFAQDSKRAMQRYVNA